MVDIEKANAYVVERFMEARPVATTMAKAIDVVPGIHANMLLHAGPPVTWERMAGPMRGAMIGALMFEGKAKSSSPLRSAGSSRQRPASQPRRVRRSCGSP